MFETMARARDACDKPTTIGPAYIAVAQIDVASGLSGKKDYVTLMLAPRVSACVLDIAG